jgi:hypothetical protein
VTTIDVNTLPDDAATLKAFLRATIIERDALLARAVQAESERDALRHELKLRLKALFGPRTEKLDRAQLELFLDRVEAAQHKAAAESAPIRVAAHDRRKGGRKPFPADLPRERIVHDLPEAEKACPCCGEPRLPIAEATREVLEVVPAQIKIVEHVRPVYLCPTCEGAPVKAPAPKLPLRKGYAGAGLLAMIAVSKFAGNCLPGG